MPFRLLSHIYQNIQKLPTNLYFNLTKMLHTTPRKLKILGVLQVLGDFGYFILFLQCRQFLVVFPSGFSLYARFYVKDFQ